jgi:hypothetical protein
MSLVVNQIQFPNFTGARCLMMPFIQGDSNSLPKAYRQYADIIESNFIEKGKMGYLTIDESFVKANTSQRGYNSFASNRNVHVEVGRNPNHNYWGDGGGGSWAGKPNTILKDDTMVLIANSISDTCRLWDTIEKSYTKDGDLSEYLDKYPEKTAISLKAGEVAKISIFTPHECVTQKESGYRQFFRIVGDGVTGREEYFTVNPLLN